MSPKLSCSTTTQLLYPALFRKCATLVRNAFLNAFAQRSFRQPSLSLLPLSALLNLKQHHIWPTSPFHPSCTTLNHRTKVTRHSEGSLRRRAPMWIFDSQNQSMTAICSQPSLRESHILCCLRASPLSHASCCRLQSFTSVGPTNSPASVLRSFELLLLAACILACVCLSAYSDFVAMSLSLRDFLFILF